MGTPNAANLDDRRKGCTSRSFPDNFSEAMSARFFRFGSLTDFPGLDVNGGTENIPRFVQSPLLSSGKDQCWEVESACVMLKFYGRE